MDPLQQQAQLEAQVKYAPQQQALMSLLQNAQAAYGQTVATQQGAARMMEQSANQAMPVVRNVYDNADNSRRQQLGDVQQQYAHLGPAADIFRAALARESLQSGTGLAQSKADAQSELERRIVQAHEGAMFATQNAGRQYLMNIMQIGQQLAGLSGQRGDFTAATLQSLLNHRQDLGVTLRGQDLAHQDRQAQIGVNQQNANTRAGAQGGRGSGFNAGAQAKALTQIQSAMSYIGQLQGAGLNEGTIRQLLVQGHRTKGGTTIPSFPAPYVEAAYEAKGWGVITPHTASILRGNYSVDPGRFPWRVGNPPQVRQPPNPAAQIGGFFR